MTAIATPRRRRRLVDPHDLPALLEYFREMQAAALHVPEAFAEYLLWRALADELHAYLSPAAVDQPLLPWEPG